MNRLTTFAAVLAVLSSVLFGCSSKTQRASSPTNGTTVLLFPEWAVSASAFERTVYTNYFIVYSNGFWFTRERQNDGALAAFWKDGHGNKTVSEAKSDFGMNIQWNVYRAMYDARSK